MLQRKQIDEAAPIKIKDDYSCFQPSINDRGVRHVVADIAQRSPIPSVRSASRGGGRLTPRT